MSDLQQTIEAMTRKAKSLLALNGKVASRIPKPLSLTPFSALWAGTSTIWMTCGTSTAIRARVTRFGLTQEQRRMLRPSGKQAAWTNQIRWTRLRLVKSGDLDGSCRRIWAITDQGRRRMERKA